MMHQNGRKKLNMKSSHRKAVLRNQVIHLINHGVLVTTKPRLKEVKRLAERIITIAREGNNFNARRRVQSLLPYDNNAIYKLFSEVAPRYVGRQGGYTRMIPMGRRASDTAQIAKLEWV